MRSARLLAATALITAVVACDRREATLTPAHAAAIQDSVKAMLADFQRLSAARQYDSASSLYAEGAGFRWIENGEVRARSAAQIRKGLGAVPRTTRIETTFQDLDITPVAPGVALVITPYRTRFVDSAGGGFAFGGVLSMTIVHRPEGWRFLQGHTSSPPAKPTP